MYTFLAQPVYESTARVLIDMNAKQAPLSFLEFSGSVVSNKITNELENLKSYSMAEAVAKALFEKEYLDESRSTRISILFMVDGEPQETLATVQQVTEALFRSVDFIPTRDSDIIKITARSANPYEAALIANTYAQVYAERNLSASRAKSKAVREFLQSQLQIEGGALGKAEQKLQSYMQSSGMVTLDAEAKRVIEQLSELEARRDAMEVEITSRSKTLASYKEELATQEPNVAKSIEQANDSYIRILQDQLATLEVQRDVIIAQNPSFAGKTSYNQKLNEIDGQIAALKKNLQGRTKEFLTSLQPGEGAVGSREGSAGFIAQMKQRIIEQQIDLNGFGARKEALNKVITNYESQFNQIPRKSIQFARLQRTSLSNEKLYLMIQEKFNEAAITEKSEFGYVAIMDPAVVSTRPVSPGVVVNLLLGVLVGLGLGMATVLLRADLDIRVRDPDDLKLRGYSPLSTIGCIKLSNRNGQSDRVLPQDGKVLDSRLVAYFNPLSPIAESYRYLRANIQLAHEGKRVRAIVVTSANPKEGKSTTVSNLAIAFAEAEKKVLLVDADLRRPALHTMFGQERDPGLADVLMGKLPLTNVVQPGMEHLDIVFSGCDIVNPSGMLGSSNMQKFIEQATQTYDVVLFDSPPLHAVSDAAVLARMVDGAILVVSAGYTKVPSLERAVESLTGIGGKLLGMVLNNYDSRKAFRGPYGEEGYGYYSYGYNSSYGEKKKKHHA
jgi:tyrosine-protein kinase Etk/Wzc